MCGDNYTCEIKDADFFFFRTGQTSVTLCDGVFCRKRPRDIKIKGLYMMCSVRWKSGTECFAKMKKKDDRKHICQVAIAYTVINNTDKFNYLYKPRD